MPVNCYSDVILNYFWLPICCISVVLLIPLWWWWCYCSVVLVWCCLLLFWWWCYCCYCGGVDTCCYWWWWCIAWYWYCTHWYRGNVPLTPLWYSDDAIVVMILHYRACKAIVPLLVYCCCWPGGDVDDICLLPVTWLPIVVWCCLTCWVQLPAGGDVRWCNYLGIECQVFVRWCRYLVACYPVCCILVLLFW